MTDRKALVTGGAKRIGRATVLALAECGCDVLIHYHSSENEADDLAEDVRKTGRTAWTFQADLSSEKDATELFDRARNAAGPIDILINNASIFPSDHVRDFSLADLERNVMTNAFAPLVLARALAAQGRPGTVVNLLDARIVDYDAQHAAYHLSKRMLFSLTRMLALELAPTITVNGVAPGLVLPPPGEDESYLEALKHTNPMERVGTVQAVTDAILYLAAGNFVTGQVLFVDGGRHLRGSVYGL